MKIIYLLFCVFININIINTLENVWVGSIFTSVMDKFSFIPVNNNSICQKHSDIYIENIKNGTYWAIKMFDSSVKSVGGIIDGDNYHYGYPSQCVRTKVAAHNISGKYCLVRSEFVPNLELYPDFYSPNVPLDRDFPPYDTMLSYWEALRFKRDVLWHNRTKINWGICIPDSCHVDDLKNSLNKTLQYAFESHGIQFIVNITDQDCYTQAETNNRTVTFGAKVWLTVTSFLVILVIISSTYDWFLRKGKINEKNRHVNFENYCIPFSVISNTERFCKIPEDSDKFEVLFGMKALSMLILVFGHSGMARLGNGVKNLVGIEEFFRNPVHTFTSNGTIVVDTFFLIGGYLVAHQVINLLNKRGRVNIILIYLDRLLRMTPTYLFVITFYMYMLPLIGEGPRWKEIVIRESERCKKNWWTNLLYINNFVDPTNMCMLQSWYLTADMQMFVFSVPLVYFIWKNPKLKVQILSAVAIISILIPTFLTYTGKKWGTFPMVTDWFYDPPTVPIYYELYINSYARYIPYIAGIIALFVTEHLRMIGYKFTSIQKTLYFIIGFFIIFGSFLYVTLRFYGIGYQYNVIENTIFSPLCRVIWCTVMLVIITIHRVNGFGVVSDILSMNIWVPLSRLNLSMLLIHIGIMLFSIATEEGEYYHSMYDILLIFCGYYLFSIVFSLIVNYLIESPSDLYCKRLKNALLGGGNRGSSQGKINRNIGIDNNGHTINNCDNNGKKINGKLEINGQLENITSDDSQNTHSNLSIKL